MGYHGIELCSFYEGLWGQHKIDVKQKQIL
jgi:hypothetical protein